MKTKSSSSSSSTKVRTNGNIPTLTFFDEYDDDICYGRVRDEPNYMVSSLRPMLPSPIRELSFLPRAGWNYQPSTRNAPSLDRLGSGIAERTTKATISGKGQRQRGRRRSKDNISDHSEDTSTSDCYPKPSTKMIIPASYTSTLSTDKRGNNENGNNPSNKKRPKLSYPSSTATVVTNSTAGGSSFSTNNTVIVSLDSETLREEQKDDQVLKALPPSVGTIPIQQKQKQQQQQQQQSKSSAKIGSMPPKAALYQWYGKKPRKIQLKAVQYIIWDNGRMTHEQLFTSLFICPTTKEAFLAGPWNGTTGEGATEDAAAATTIDGSKNKNSTVLPDKDGLYWYPRKIMAEHAVAARAWDCLLMREGGNLDGSRLGELEPYWPSQRPAMPLNRIPARILETLQISDNEKTDDSLLSSKHNAIKDIDSGTILTTVDDKKNIQLGTSDNDEKNIDKKHRGRSSSRNQIRRKLSVNNDNNPKNRDMEKYRAQRLSSNSQRAHHYQPQQQQQQRNFPVNQRSTYEQSQSGFTPEYFDKHQVQHHQVQHHQVQHQNQYQNQYNSHIQEQNQHSGGIYNYHYQQQQQPNPPPPPAPLRNHNNYPTGWNNQHHQQQRTFGNNNNNNNSNGNHYT